MENLSVEHRQSSSRRQSLQALDLPIRGVLYTLSNNPYFWVSVQIVDGIAAGIFGVLGVIIVAELTKGTGRFNFVQEA